MYIRPIPDRALYPGHFCLSTKIFDIFQYFMKNKYANGNYRIYYPKISKKGILIQVLLIYNRQPLVIRIIETAKGMEGWR